MPETIDGLKFAVRVAIQAMVELRKKYAFDHNLAVMFGGPQNPNQFNASRKYQELTEAIDILAKWGGVGLAVVALVLSSLACTLSTVESAQPTASVTAVPKQTAVSAAEVESGAVFEPTESAGENYQVCNCETLNVRSSPGTDGVVVAWLKPVTWVRVVEYQGEWARLTRGGWVHAGYLCP